MPSKSSRLNLSPVLLSINSKNSIGTPLPERYTDYRWVTFKQMMDRDWTFKTDAEGNSVGKGKGVPIEFFELIDKRTGHARIFLTREYPLSDRR